MQLVDTMTRLFEIGGAGFYGGEEVSQLQHALQAARLAEKDNASRALITAALLHDVGHLLGAGDEGLAERGVDARHELSGSRFLERWFDAEVTEPVRIHVGAKSYLCRVEPGYYDSLSPASRDSLAVQGGPLDARQAQRFQEEPFFADAVRLRRWDDRAKDPRAITPGLDYYLRIATEAARA